MKVPGSRTLLGISGRIFGKKIPKDWLPYSHLYIRSENSNWVLDSIKMEMTEVCKKISIPLIDQKYSHKLKNQCIFFTSKYDALNHIKNVNNKIAFPMFHGNPENDVKFKYHFNLLSKFHDNVDRIQVSNSFMKSVVLDTGIDKSKVFQIPISVDIDNFPFVTSKIKKSMIKEKLGFSKNSFLIGSFQKDGQGWGKGDRPKLIKGPDIFIEVIGALKSLYSNIEVLLTGPARGYVKKELRNLNVKYRHTNLDDFGRIASYYQALDMYLVSSREEGGPRSILESMASGVPLVTTRVGQAIDLVEHKRNGWMIDVGDIDGLIQWSKYVIENSDKIDEIVYEGRSTAMKNSYQAQLPLWKDFMTGFVV